MWATTVNILFCCWCVLINAHEVAVHTHRLIAKLTLVRTAELADLSRFRAHYKSRWALGVSRRWFISTRRKKCRSFLFSLLITTWHPLSRPPSPISRWVLMPWAESRELHYGGVIHSCCLWSVVTAAERVNIWWGSAWWYCRTDLQWTVLLYSHWGAFIFACLVLWVDADQ